MLTPKEHSQATNSSRSSLQMADASGGGTHGAQTMERPHCCPAARTLPPIARAGCGSIPATAPSSFPASMKGGTSTCGSTPPDSHNAHPRGKGDSSEREGSGASAAGAQVCCSFTRHHCPCLVTGPRRLVLPHAVSFLSILQDRGDSGNSQKGTQAMPPSTSATLMVVLTTHRSEGLVRVVHGERHDVATAPPRSPSGQASHDLALAQLISLLNLHARMVHC